MSQTSMPNLESWHSAELTDEDISKLREDLDGKIRKEDRVDLLPHHGFLYFKDKIWVGKVKSYIPNDGLCDQLQDDTERIVFYVLELKYRIIPELQRDGYIPQLESILTIFTLSVVSDEEESSKVFQSFGKYFVSLYGGEQQQLHSKGPFIHCVNNKLLSALFSQIQPNFKEIWNMREGAFMAVLLDEKSLISNVEHDSNYEIREMSLHETLYGAERWKFSSESTNYQFAASHSLGMAVGAFIKGSNVPASWAFASFDGAIAALQTAPEHRGKGLAKAVVKTVAGKYFKLGLIPFVFIEPTETSFIPESLFQGLDFELHKEINLSWSFQTE